MKNINEQVVNENVVEVAETIADKQTVEQFPSDEILKSLKVSREEFEEKVKENSKLSHDEQLEQLEKMIDENKKLNEEIKQINKQIERTNFISSLNAEGLSEFVELFDLETVEEKVQFLKKVKNEILVTNSYVPKDVAKQDEYTQAIEQKDVNKAIGFKFSKLFGGK